MKVTIAPYTDDWKLQFSNERELLSKALATLSPRIEHMGSTAVEGLDAKPTIDIMIGLADESLFPEAVEMMLAAGYSYIKKYEVDMPERRLFMKLQEPPSPDKKIFDLDDELPDREIYPSSRNIHMVKYGAEFWKRHIAFRDWLRNNKSDRDEYAALKHKLAEKEWKSINDYTEAKSELIESIAGKYKN